MTTQEYENEMLEAFIQKPLKVEWYKKAFEKYNIQGIKKIAWVWSWWAFFGGVFFLLYRKAYKAALILFIVSVVVNLIPIPMLGFILWILQGGFLIYFVYDEYLNKKSAIEQKTDDLKERIKIMEQLGGYNQWVVYVGAILSAFYFLSIVGYIAIIALGLHGVH